MIWLDKSTDMASPEEMTTFGLLVNAPAKRFQRIRTSNGEPLGPENETVPKVLLPYHGHVTLSFNAALVAVGHKPVTGWQRVTNFLADTLAI